MIGRAFVPSALVLMVWILGVPIFLLASGCCVEPIARKRLKRGSCGSSTRVPPFFFCVPLRMTVGLRRLLKHGFVLGKIFTG